MRRERKKIVRFYDAGTVYFVTSKTRNNFPFFAESCLAEIFIAELKYNKKLHGFSLYTFCLLPDHFHLLLKPSETINISQVMKTLKENMSRDINRAMFYGLPGIGATAPSPLPGELTLMPEHAGKFLLRQYGKPWLHFPKFAWQKSFHDHTIRSERDYQYHYRYTAYNFRHHNLPENWRYTSLNYPEMLD